MEGKTNPFAVDQAWEVSDAILPPGDHFVHVQEIDATQTSSGGFPQLVLRVGNDEGSIREWMVTIPSTIGRVQQLCKACDVPFPDVGDFENEGDGYRMSTLWAGKFIGKPCGVRVHDEPDRLDPSKMRTRVQGFLTPDQVQAPPIGDSGGNPNPFQPAQGKEDDIPF